jgi:CheY-like chemotaxis protein
MGDPGRLRQVVFNLVGNAIKFTDQGEVALRAIQRNRTSRDVELEFAVRDTGIGIPEDKLNRLFTAFSQVDASTTRKYGGTGLGLAISTQLVQMMKGRIWVDSEAGRGSCFSFTATFGLAPGVRRRKMDFHDGDFQGVRVLVVDDNDTNRRVLSGMLRHCAMEVTAVETGTEALEQLRKGHESGEPFTLVLMDNMMPEMDGFELAEQISREPEWVEAKLMMISSAARREDAERCRTVGVPYYLSKPIRRSELLATIQDAIGLEAVARNQSEPKTKLEGCSDSLRLLLAEDNLVNQKLAIRLLEKRGHRVTVAGNGKEAMAAIAREPFDAVLMDVQMPEMDGIEVTRRLRRREKETGGHLPIIAMTAHAMKGDRQRCLEAGMDDYVSKPLQPNELFDTVERNARARDSKGVASGAAAGNELNSLRSRECSGSIERTGRECPDGAEASEVREKLHDRSVALANVGGDEELFAEIVTAFCKECPERIAQIRDALIRGDAKLLQRAAHTIKGNAGTVGAPSVAALARRLEEMGESGETTGAEQLTGKLESALDHLQRELTVRPPD